MSSTNVNDRNVLQLGATAVLVAVMAVLPGPSPTGCEPTPEVAPGPFYPTRDRADEDADLTRLDTRPLQAKGEIIYVHGQVLDEACRPIENATVEIWQADAHGRYRHERDDLSVPIDSNFQGWGEAVTDAQGRYRFKTVKPAPYPVDETRSAFRSPHIHFRVTHPEHQELITEMHVAKQPLNETDSVLQQLSAKEQEQITVTPSADENARGPVYSFDLTLSALKSALVSPERLDRYVGTYQLVGGAETSHVPKLFDVHMLGATWGWERTVEEYDQLFTETGMELAGHHTAEAHPMSVVEGRVP